MYVMVSYDIVDNKRRTRLMKFLKEFGERVQQSVFECDLDETLYETMKYGVEGIIDKRADRVRYYPLCKGCLRRVLISGWGEVKPDEGFTIV